uniref:Uncharacterized protein n=1 Tax=Oryza meridionalis TaxID=40149 RepID=A0A0E0BZN9_9ORYZ
MEAITMSPSSVSSHHLDVDAASTSEDMSSLQEGLLFSDSLKDLRNLRSQLYSAAEYFEVFYRNNSQKSTVMTSLKDYTVEALVSTVDHLGFVSYKVDNLVKERSDEVNETEFRVSSVEQRVRICQQTIDQEGRSQQSLLIRAPKYHRRTDIVESAIHPVSEPPRLYASWQAIYNEEHAFTISFSLWHTSSITKQEQVHQYRIPIPLHDLPRLQEGHLFIQSILDKLQCSYTLTGAITKSRRKAQARAGGSSNHCSQGVGGGTMSHCTATWTNIDFLNVTVNQLSLVHLSDI